METYSTNMFNAEVLPVGGNNADMLAVREHEVGRGKPFRGGDCLDAFQGVLIQQIYAFIN